TSKAFDEIHTPDKSIHYLTLPASKFEKFFFSWVNTTVLFFVISLVFFYLSYFISAMITYQWRSIPVQFFNIFDYGFLDTVIDYLAIQPVFFLGAIAFKKASFIKMCLVMLGLSIALTIYSMLIYFSLYGFSNFAMLSTQIDADGYINNQIGTIAEYAMNFIMGPWMLFIAFIKFQEKEI
ncbi:MAG: hypothetical protein IH948_04940, partial [Bacteroidetes bacterium]|nr:hypothetical protein [Bacteroidota bacterium]